MYRLCLQYTPSFFGHSKGELQFDLYICIDQTKVSKLAFIKCPKMTAPILLPNNQKDIPLVATALFPMSYVCRASVLDQDGGHSIVQYFDLPHLLLSTQLSLLLYQLSLASVKLPPLQPLITPAVGKCGPHNLFMLQLYTLHSMW